MGGIGCILVHSEEQEQKVNREGLTIEQMLEKFDAGICGPNSRCRVFQLLSTEVGVVYLLLVLCLPASA